MSEAHKNTSPKLRILIGIGFILFGVICLVNVGYVSQSIVLGLTALFGVVCYWFFFPGLIIAGILLILFRKKEIKLTKNPIFIGVLILIFGLLILFSNAVFYGNTEYSLRLNSFNSIFKSVYLDSINNRIRLINHYRFNPYSTNLAGGWFGYLFAALLNTLITELGCMISSIVFLIIALILITYKYIALIANKIKNKRDLNNTAKALDCGSGNAKNAQLYNPEENDVTSIKEFDPASFNDMDFNEQFIPQSNAIFDDNTPLEKANLFNNDDEVPEIKEVSPVVNTNPVNNLNNSSSVASTTPPEVKKILKPYRLPSLDLFNDYEIGDLIKKNEANCIQNEEIINTVFTNLKIGAKVVGHTTGPRVTRYDIQVNATSSVQQIPRILLDLSQRLGGVLARFEPVVTGKSTAGLEIANKESATIGFKEIVSTFPDGEKNRLLIPFGKNISGEIKYAPLNKFPHLLIGGATGSGKSIFVHSILMSILTRNTPDDVKLLLIDPKLVEFSHYKDLPFLLCPVITDPGKAKVALTKLVEEMDIRYAKFADTLTRDINSYNEKVLASGRVKMPYIVVVVDEFADLIIQNKKIDQDISRITAKARAAGIHLIIATQRPSVDVITGVIKANLPVRVALSVPDMESSKTILGGQGAEELLGNGDMLISCPQIQAAGLVRAQGCFVSEAEIDRVVKFINAQREPMYDPRFMDLEDHNAKEAKSEEPTITAAEARAAKDDDLYEYIKEQVYKREYTSISLIQRENGIGFNRAGRMFGRLQQEGLVSTENEASKGCKVLKENFHFEKKEPVIGSEEVSEFKPSNNNDGNNN